MSRLLAYLRLETPQATESSVWRSSGSRLAAKAKLRRRALRGVGVGAPGPLDLRKDRIILMPNIGWRNVPLTRLFARATRLPAFAEKLDAELRAKPAEEQSMHTLHLDGSEIAEADVEAVRDAVWQNLVVDPWQRGDVVLWDNRSTMHRRNAFDPESRRILHRTQIKGDAAPIAAT